MNPRAALTTYSLSRGAPSASLGTSPNCPRCFSSVCWKRYLLYNIFFVLSSIILTFFASFYLPDERREWDSNPRALADKRFSRPPRYDHFDISPYAILRFSTSFSLTRITFYHQTSSLSRHKIKYFSKKFQLLCISH